MSICAGLRLALVFFFGVFILICVGSSLAFTQTATNSSVAIVIDQSGSMWGPVRGAGETRTEIAKAFVQQFGQSAPEIWPDMALSIVAFGHQYHRDQGRCDDIEQLLKPTQMSRPAQSRKVIDVIDALGNPQGRTPLTLAIGEAARAIGRGVVVIVSDFEETCEPDPCFALNNLRNRGELDDITIGYIMATADGNERLDEMESFADCTDADLIRLPNGAAARKNADDILKTLSSKLDRLNEYGLRERGAGPQAAPGQEAKADQSDNQLDRRVTAATLRTLKLDVDFEAPSAYSGLIPMIILRTDTATVYELALADGEIEIDGATFDLEIHWNDEIFPFGHFDLAGQETAELKVELPAPRLNVSTDPSTDVEWTVHPKDDPGAALFFKGRRLKQSLPPGTYTVRAKDTEIEREGDREITLRIGVATNAEVELNNYH